MVKRLMWERGRRREGRGVGQLGFPFGLGCWRDEGYCQRFGKLLAISTYI